jgi:hypothetical protein
VINSPDPLSTRSLLADWIELTSFVRQRPAGAGDLESLLRLSSDDDRERVLLIAGIVVEEEIAETRREALLSRVAEELDFRRSSLGADYPFIVDGDPLRVSLRPHINSTSHSAYLFMLLMSCARDHLLPKNSAVQTIIDNGRTLFHLCASFGVSGLLQDGHTFWFGFPRPNKSNFSNALAQLAEKLGFSKPKTPPPAGLPVAAKDDQVDVIGWRPFGDRRIGTLVVICQAATGDDWDGKSVVSHLGAFTDWFERAPYRTAMPSLAVPFPCHHEIDDREDEDYDQAVFNALQRLNGRHGVVLDRLRITESIAPILGNPIRIARVGGFSNINVFDQWIRRLKPQLAT